MAVFQRRGNGNRVDDWMTMAAPFGSASMSGTPADSEFSEKINQIFLKILKNAENHLHFTHEMALAATAKWPSANFS